MGLITDSYGWLRQNQDVNYANTILERRAEDIKAMSFSYVYDPIADYTEQNVTVKCNVYNISATSKKVLLTASRGSRQVGRVNLILYMYGGM